MTLKWQDWHPTGSQNTIVRAQQTFGIYVTPDALCPDLLRYEQIGEADGWRGRCVRAFFFVMRLWPV